MKHIIMRSMGITMLGRSRRSNNW